MGGWGRAPSSRPRLRPRRRRPRFGGSPSSTAAPFPVALAPPAHDFGSKNPKTASPCHVGHAVHQGHRDLPLRQDPR
eukprot:8303525-Lingulodinium_polyedra.AAC.1